MKELNFKLSDEILAPCFDRERDYCMLDLVPDEGDNRFLLNNDDLDPDGNYFTNRSCTSKYATPAEAGLVTHKLKNIPKIMHIN